MTLVQVRREEHFKNERRIIKMYIGIYCLCFIYDLGTIIFAAFQFEELHITNKGTIDINSAVNLSVTILLIIMFVIIYLRFRYHTLTKYHNKFKLHWKNWLAIFLITFSSLCIICAYDVILLRRMKAVVLDI